MFLNFLVFNSQAAIYFKPVHSFDCYYHTAVFCDYLILEDGEQHKC